jgi:hypothetical protein
LRPDKVDVQWAEVANKAYLNNLADMVDGGEYAQTIYSASQVVRFAPGADHTTSFAEDFLGYGCHDALSTKGHYFEVFILAKTAAFIVVAVDDLLEVLGGLRSGDKAIYRSICMQR